METLGLLERLYSHGEAVAGSEAARALAEELIRLVAEATGVHPSVVRLPVATWRDLGAVVECGGLRLEGAALPQTLGGRAEGRLVEVHCTEPTCFEHVQPGDVVAARLPEDPDDVTTLYVAALEAGASALIVYDRWPGRLRRIVVSGRWDYAPLPSPAPMPAVYLRREHGERLVKHCVGARVRVEAGAEITRSTGRIIEAVLGDGDHEVVLMAHYDHWLGGAGDNLAGVVALLRAAERIGRPRGYRLRLLLLDAEEFGDPQLPAWYWAYGSRWYARQLLHAGLLDEIVLVVNLEMPVRRLVLAGTPEARGLVERIAPGSFKRVEEFETCYSDGYSFAVLGVPTVTLYNIEDYIEWYHTDADEPRVPDPSRIEEAAAVAAEAVREAGERGPAALDYRGYAELLEGIASRAPIEARRAAYMLAEETRLAAEDGRFEALRRAYSIVNSRLGRCVFNGDYRWDTGGFEPRLAPALRAAIEALGEGAEAPGDRVVPGEEVKLVTPTPTPVKRWLGAGHGFGAWGEVLRWALAAHLEWVASSFARVLLEAYGVLREARGG